MEKGKKKRCDHILGLDGYGNRIFLNDNEEYSILDYFNYCPECGKKILITITNSEELDK